MKTTVYYLGAKKITAKRAKEIIARNKEITESNDISRWAEIKFVTRVRISTPTANKE